MLLNRASFDAFEWILSEPFTHTSLLNTTQNRPQIAKANEAHKTVSERAPFHLLVKISRLFSFLGGFCLLLTHTEPQNRGLSLFSKIVHILLYVFYLNAL